MALEDYLSNQASEGTLDSEGGFTLDLSRAADKLAKFALPSHSHYLLKIIQVAHHLQADEVSVRIEKFRTVVRFRAPLGGSITDSDAIYRAFVDPLEIKDPLMFDLVSGLMGTVTDENLETLWSFSEGHSGRRVFINRERRFSIQDFKLSHPLEEDQHPNAYTLSVLHPRTWKFWLAARRRAAAARVLEENCRFSGVKISIDNRELEIHSSSVVNDHTKRTLWGSHEEIAWEADPRSSILYEMADPGEQRFCLLRPSLSAYVVRADYMNLWVSGTRVNNTLKPDGISSAAWMLQFRQNDENVSMRFAPKRVPCRAVLGLNYHAPDEDDAFRVKVVRCGVTVLETRMTEHADRFKDFQGAVLIFCDHELETDLTGLQILQNEAFLEKVESYRHLLAPATAYYKKGRDMLTM